MCLYFVIQASQLRSMRLGCSPHYLAFFMTLLGRTAWSVKGNQNGGGVTCKQMATGLIPNRGRCSEDTASRTYLLRLNFNSTPVQLVQACPFFRIPKQSDTLLSCAFSGGGVFASSVVLGAEGPADVASVGATLSLPRPPGQLIVPQWNGHVWCGTA